MFIDAQDFDGTPLDRKTIPQGQLNIESKERNNLFPWKGQFSPQLIEAFLQTYASAGAFILDPFLGSGTVLSEAGRLGYSAFGSEVNPAAFKMAEVYRFLNVKAGDRRKAVQHVEDIVLDALPASPSLFSTPARTHNIPIQQTLAKAVETKATPLHKTLL